jgi:hypothetical protein
MSGASVIRITSTGAKYGVFPSEDAPRDLSLTMHVLYLLSYVGLTASIVLWQGQGRTRAANISC